MTAFTTRTGKTLGKLMSRLYTTNKPGLGLTWNGLDALKGGAMPRKWAKYPVASPETKQAVNDWLAQESEQEQIEYLRAELGKCFRERLELRIKLSKHEKASTSTKP